MQDVSAAGPGPGPGAPAGLGRALPAAPEQRGAGRAWPLPGAARAAGNEPVFSPVTSSVASGAFFCFF